MNVNETETNYGNLDKEIEEWPEVTSPAIMEDSGNEEIDDSNQNNLNKENKRCLDDEYGKESTYTES